MNRFNEWMDKYEISHKHPTNQLIHKVFVPLIFLSILGLLWSTPFPQMLKLHAYMNWATVSAICCLLFYLFLDFKMFIGMCFQIVLMCAIVAWLEMKGILIWSSITIFVVGWIAQFYGHKVEGKKPSFTQDLTFLLIGPLWVTRFLYNKIGIKS